MKLKLTIILLFAVLLSFGQSTNVPKTLYATGTNTYAVTETSPVGYSMLEKFIVQFDNTNTLTGSSVTLNRGGYGPKVIKNVGGVDLAANDIVAHNPYLISYNGTNYVIIGDPSQVKDAIVDGVTTKAPSQNAVFDALAGALTPTSVNGVVLSGSSTPTLAVSGTTAVSGSNTGDQTTITGNAGTATTLQTGRTISGTGDATGTSGSFNGSGNASIPLTVVKINGTALSGLATGILKNTTSTGVPSIAVAGTDYQSPLSLTTTGSSGAATLISNVLNIPQYAGGSSLPTQTGKVNYELGTDGTSARWENSNRVFNVENYGAKHDYQTVSNASITSGAAILTTGTAAFASTDVGKTIRLFGAGAAGVDLVTTIITFTSSTQVTINTNAGATISSKKIEWGTDDTSSIQSAINACWTANGGTVWFPKGVYLIAGALVTSADGVNPNCQIYFPKSAYAAGGNEIAIRLVGESVPNALIGPLGSVTVSQMLSGVVLKSIIIGSGTLPAVLGSTYESGLYGNLNKSIVENIAIQTKSMAGTTHIPGTMSGFMFINCEVTHVSNVIAFTESDPFDGVEPTNATYGFYFPPALKSEAYDGVNGLVYAVGYNTGVFLAEHDQGQRYISAGCDYGFEFNSTISAHPHGGLLHSFGNKYDVKLTGGGTINYDIYVETYPSSINVKWYNNLATFYTPSTVNYNGLLRVNVIISGGTHTLATISTPANVTGKLNIIDFNSQTVKFGGGIPTPQVSSGLTNTNNTNAIIGADTGGLAATTSDAYAGFFTSATQSNTALAPVGQWQSLNAAIAGSDKRLWMKSVYTNGATNTGIVYDWILNAGTLTNIWQLKPTNVALQTGVSFNITDKSYFGNATTSPTAKIHIAAGSATANTAPIQLTGGPFETTPRTGLIEYDGTNLAFTPVGTNRLTVFTGYMGQTTLVSGTKAVTVNGVTTGSFCVVTTVTPSGTSLTTDKQCVCTTNTITIQANIAAGTINTADGSVVNYMVKP